MLRATPNCTTVRPADALEMLEAWKLAVAAKARRWALVLTRQKVPFLGERDAAVEQAPTSSPMRTGTGPTSS